MDFTADPACELGLLLNETSGPATDSCTANDGSLIGSPDQLDGGYDFDGAGDYLLGTSTVDIPGTTMTIVARMKVDQTNWDSWANIIGEPYDDGDEGWNYPHYKWGFLRQSNSADQGYFVYTVGTSNKQSAPTGSGYFETGEHTYGVTRDGDTITFYKDGMPFGSPHTLADGVLDGGYKWLAANRADYSPGEFMAAETDEIGVFSRALSSSEMQQIHLEGLDGTRVSSSENQPPTADADANHMNGETPLSVDFDGLGSSDLDGTIDSYHWDFDDGGSTSTNETPNHTYTAAGTYEVTLTVTDNGGKMDTDTVTITVTDPPVGGLSVDITAMPTNVDTNVLVAFTSTVGGATGGTGEFLEQGGIVIIEAEHFHGNVPRSDPAGMVWDEASAFPGFYRFRLYGDAK